MSAILSVIPYFTDSDGSPLDAGYLYFGAEGYNPETNPITVYWDSALTVPASQPIRTSGGYAVRNGAPSQLFVNVQDYSIIVRNKALKLVFNQSSVPVAKDSIDFGTY